MLCPFPGAAPSRAVHHTAGEVPPQNQGVDQWVPDSRGPISNAIYSSLPLSGVMHTTYNVLAHSAAFAVNSV